MTANFHLPEKTSLLSGINYFFINHHKASQFYVILLFLYCVLSTLMLRKLKIREAMKRLVRQQYEQK